MLVPDHRRAELSLLSSFLVCAIACNQKTSAPTVARPAPTPPGIPAGQGTAVAVGTEGGSVASADGRLTVRIPPGAIPRGTTFSVQPITNGAPGGLGSAYRLGPAGVTFLKPVTFTFVAGWTGAPVERLTIAFQEEQGYWVHSRNVIREPAARTLTVATTHFSDWTIVSADPTRDMSGTFTVASSIDTPFSSVGQGSLTYAGEDATERLYILSGTATLQQPVTSGGLACTLADSPIETFPTNVAEVLNTPDRFWWGTSSHWDITCGSTPTFLETAFDTMGINRIGCARRYVPTPVSATPIITLDRLQGSYVIDCGAAGTISATWDFLRCGGPCASSNPCHTAAISCATTPPACADTGSVADGTSCGANAVCGGGVCNACTPGAACTPTNPCHVGVTSCSTGVQQCVDTLTNLPDGTSTTCPANQVCSGGACSPCNAGAACTPSNPCHQGTTSCTTGAPVCDDAATNVADGTSCGTDRVCSAGACGPCAQGAACTLVNACVATATIECGSGLPVCTMRASATDGTVCGTSLACSGGSCLLSPCAAAASCIPANPCHLGATTCGPPDACADSGTAVSDGASCGTNLVCRGGTCLACPASDGAGCASTNPCAITAGIRCDAATGAPTCVDLTFQPDGTPCGTGLACLAGVCQ